MNRQTTYNKQYYINQMKYICACIATGIEHHLQEIIVDNFAGGGGASTGIEMATGYSVYAAINHDPEAVRMHMANHPSTKHYCESVWEVNPFEVCNGYPVGLVWFSPDCKHFSKAKGGKPKDKSIRGLAWVALRWAGLVRPRVIMLENVEEFKDWGPLNRNHHPLISKKGSTFSRFVKQLEELGYAVEYRELVAADYGAPTTRKRFFMIARCDGKAIVWPKKTHAPIDSREVKQGLCQPYLGAYTQIDFSRPCPSIFASKSEILKEYGIKSVRPLAENTMNRIAKGLQKFIFNNPEPFIIQVNHSGDRKPQDIREPMPTITAKHGFGLVTPYITQLGQTGFATSRGRNIKSPLSTVVSKNEHCLIEPLMVPLASRDSQKQDSTRTVIRTSYSNNMGKEITLPLQTAASMRQHSALCISYLMQQQGQSVGTDLREPVNTITAVNHMAEVRAFLIKYYGTATGQNISEPLDTITGNDRFGLIEVYGENYQIIDIGLRMLEPDELYGCMGFPDDYIINQDCNGREIKRSEQVRKCGNAVSPPIPAALVKANLLELCVGPRTPICRPDRIKQEKTGQLRFA